MTWSQQPLLKSRETCNCPAKPGQARQAQGSKATERRGKVFQSKDGDLALGVREAGSAAARGLLGSARSAQEWHHGKQPKPQFPRS